MSESLYARCDGTPGPECATISKQVGILRSIVASLPEGVIVADEQGRALFFNEAAESILGIGSRPVGPGEWSTEYGCYLQDGVTRYPAEQLPLARALRGDEVDDEPILIRNRNRPDEVWIRASACPLRDDAGSVRGGLVIFRDETARRKTRAVVRRLFAALNQTADTVLITDREGVIEFVNPAFEQTTGYTREEALGRTPALLRSGQHGPEFYERLWRTILDGKNFRATIINRRKDGEHYWCEQSITPLRSDGGQITHFVSTLRDVTERERALQRERDFNSAILSTVGALVIVVNREGRIVLFNKACEQVTGFHFEEVEGRHFWTEILLPADERDAVKTRMEEVSSGEHRNDSENRLLTRDGGSRLIRWRYTTLDDDEGLAGFIIATGIDITRRRKAEQAVEQAHSELEHRVEERTRDLRDALAELESLKERLHTENIYLREEIKTTHDFDEIVGQSDGLRKALHRVDQVAATDATVLILGETGTGKELVARAIHNRSPRMDRPLVKVNCAALPASLIESELFGHVKGAFTGAVDRRTGRFEVADGGTIFLDEIGDLPVELQVKLLRVLQEGEFEPVGSVRTRKVDVRVIAATNRNLEQAVREGSFRSDLYYRLGVVPVSLPPLRNRREDIPLLVRHFIKKKQRPMGRRIEAVPTVAMSALQSYHWPGNIRELENVIERAMILSNDRNLVLDESFPGFGRGSLAGPVPGSLDDVERAHILGVLGDCGWKVKGPGNAAERLGLKPSTLRDRMKKLGIVRPRRGAPGAKGIDL